MIITPEWSRVAKTMVDAGRCSFPDAQAKLSGATLSVRVDPACSRQPAAQAAVLTAVVIGIRCFPGGVWLSGVHDTPLVLAFRASTLEEAAACLGARIGTQPTTQTVVIGATAEQTSTDPCLHAWWDDWLAGVRPAGDRSEVGYGGNTLSGIAAAAMAVGHAFRNAFGENPWGFQQAQVLSLWSPGSHEQGPRRVFAPDNLWLIGLGNLGQAYVWVLSLLPYRDPGQLALLLQDQDRVADVNWGTSILVERGEYGLLKTRLVEDWALKRGFSVRRIDTFVDGDTRRKLTDPAIALSGLDNIAARRLLDNVGFERVIDCGLGGGGRSYGRLRLNVFDPDYMPSKHFSGVNQAENMQANLRLPAYQSELAAKPEAACGMAELAGAMAAVPFVSVVLAAMAISQAIRISSGVPHVRSVVGSFDALDRIRSAPALVPSPRVGYADLGL